MTTHNVHKKRILIVDDDRAVTNMLTMLLEMRGYEVTIAPTAKEALSQVSSATDLILLDLILPDEEGFTLCRKFKENKETSHIPIIMLTAKVMANDLIEGLYLGADDYITKPFDYEELVARIEVVMRRGSLLHKQGNLMIQGQEAIVEELRKIIDQKLVVSFYQPIFLINPIRLLGFEALTRPATKSMLSNPELLFKAALQFGFYQDLEMLAWEKAAQYVSSHLTNEQLFLNCNPYFVEGPKFLNVKPMFEKNNIRIENIVLEITERSAISDFKSFYEHLHRYREYGFKFAIDDVGGGYASIEAIVETKPEVVKIDRHIIRDLEIDPYKRSIVKFIVAFCKENKILSIAEGIETKRDLIAVKALGVDAAQGYYLFNPSPKIDFNEIHQAQELISSEIK